MPSYKNTAKSRQRAERGARAWRSGKTAESMAALWLRLKGYRIAARRWRCPCGEIDIIARKGALIAIVEIKARPGLRAAQEAVSRAQQKRIENAADMWLAQQADYAALCLRFDIIAIIPRRLPKHIKAAWTA